MILTKQNIKELIDAICFDRQYAMCTRAVTQMFCNEHNIDYDDKIEKIRLETVRTLSKQNGNSFYLDFS